MPPLGMSDESNSPKPLLRQAQDERGPPDDPFDVSAEDGRASSQGPAPRDPPPASQPPICRRRTLRQGTSYMAFRHEPLDPDDPLLGFRPVPHKAPRRNSITPARQRAFIAALAEGGIVKDAARAIGASMEALYKLRHRPGAEEFSAAWDRAIDRGVARLEDSALARAIEGEERLVVSGGKVLGTERRHNEALVMFFLRGRRGDRYAADWRQLTPGHPVYEKLRKQIIAEYEAAQPSEQEVLDGLHAKLDRMMREDLAARAERGEEVDWDEWE